jgi:hypothetical protein
LAAALVGMGGYSCDGRNVDYSSAIALLHLLVRGLSAQPWTGEIDRESFLPKLKGKFQK